jgi:hypothetical protein
MQAHAQLKPFTRANAQHNHNINGQNLLRKKESSPTMMKKLNLR